MVFEVVSPRSGLRPGAARARLAGVAISLLLGCQAPVQRVPLDVEPAGARIFVDGDAIEGSPDALDLRSDVPHVIHVERDGYRAEQMVLETRPDERGTRLEPGEIRLRLEPVVPTEREIRIEGSDS